MQEHSLITVYEDRNLGYYIKEELRKRKDLSFRCISHSITTSTTTFRTHIVSFIWEKDT